MYIPSGDFLMGDDRFYPDEAPVRKVHVNEFFLDNHEVTNQQFSEFVNKTGYITAAERDAGISTVERENDTISSYPREAGSNVFVKPANATNNYLDWWQYIPGANWKKPYGPSGTNSLDNAPVVHLTYKDMLAYAEWKGGRLPTEEEWEYAALSANQPGPGDPPTEANIWQGVFPILNSMEDDFFGISPVGCFAPNQFGLYDMIGNVWEMTSTPFASAADMPTDQENAQYIIKGGSYLCAENYCRRYRPAAKSLNDVESSASHIGFRLAYDTNIALKP
ncbi:MAG: formylglycine-generating enzyme family protein [Pseudomonadota bacterium]